jgi:phosphatidylinositol alpha 1,6-mannosyltransferase
MITPRRVLYCTDTYPPQLNGVSVVTALSVDGLRSRGWEVAVISPRYPRASANVFANGAHADAEGARIASVPLPRYPDIRLAAPRMNMVRRVMAEFQPSIVHSATEFMIGWMGQREALRRGIPAVSSYHTDFSRYTVEYGMPRLRGTVQRYLSRFHQRSARVYTPGLVARDELVALGIEHVEVWGRGVDLTLFDPCHRDRAWLTTLGVAPDSFVFLHVGRLAAEKGVERILDAYRLASAQFGHGRTTHLIIAGDGPRRDALREMAPREVIFLGNLDRSTELPRLYASADAFVFASHTETLGLVVLEAIASGTPVIAAPVGGVADHLRDRVNGLCYRPGDVVAMASAMRELAGDPELTRRLARSARQSAARLSWEDELDRLSESYMERVLDKT